LIWMFTRRSDLQLERDSLGRFLPWLIAFMVYLSILAMAGMLSLNSLAERWNSGLSGTLTVQVPPPEDTVTAAVDAKRMDAILAVLEKTPGVVRVERLSEDHLLVLLEPWLGSGAGAVAGDLPLPRLIDVELENGATIVVPALQKRLNAIVAGTLVDDHGVWLKRLLTLIKTVQALAFVVLLFIGLATVGTVIFTTRTGLAIHQDAIEVLHLIGAQDTYIARQFASRALMLGLKGGLISLGLALPTLWGIGFLADSLQSGMLPDLSLPLVGWLVLISMPIAVALIAMATARLTVMKTLRKML